MGGSFSMFNWNFLCDTQHIALKYVYIVERHSQAVNNMYVYMHWLFFNLTYHFGNIVG